MNQVTIFGDIHANLPAFEAVLADMDVRALATRYCLGDLVGYGTFPNVVVAAIRERGIPTLVGNYDQGSGNHSLARSVRQLPRAACRSAHGLAGCLRVAR